MSLYSQIVDTSGAAAYPADPQVALTFEPRRFVIINEDATNTSYVSFDGSTDHVHLPGGAVVTLEHQHAKNLWLKRDSTGGDVQVIAES